MISPPDAQEWQAAIEALMLVAEAPHARPSEASDVVAGVLERY